MSGGAGGGWGYFLFSSKLPLVCAVNLPTADYCTSAAAGGIVVLLPFQSMKEKK